ncbi:sugar transferase [Sphingomonas sp.]|uniref:sugar transferase n=1 Tax=Sphingomonas sp. TaxID=28214 RepID=UPI00375313B5
MCALFFSALLPYLVRSITHPGTSQEPTSLNVLIGNVAAVVLAVWIRHSVETFPGVRASALNLPVVTASHGLIVAGIMLLRLPYDRMTLLGGYLLHLLWSYIAYFVAQRGTRLRFAIVPYGRSPGLGAIDAVDWQVLRSPDLDEVVGCNAIVADFGADLPNEWEAFLADAALAGRIVFQVKQLEESLTGRVELEHISENSFGSLVPARGYFHLKGLMDLLFALAVLPFYLVVALFVAVAIRFEGPGGVFFRQQRIGHAGRPIEVLKFRTMKPLPVHVVDTERHSAITAVDDDRITRVGGFLRRTRIDELPQIWNVLKGEMSWIGPRPEAEVLSVWYTGEIPFYRYRHVVKPGISGWAQVNQGHVAAVDDVHRKLQYDFYYIKYFSPWLDVLIVFRTIKTMFTGFGSR